MACKPGDLVLIPFPPLFSFPHEIRFTNNERRFFILL